MTGPGILALLDEADRRWRDVLAPEGRPLRVAVEAPDHISTASPRVAAEILDVLLGNAARHGEGTVRVTVCEVDRWVTVDVEDEGPGFAGDPDAAFARDGGDGLARARSLADAEGGSLVVLHAGPHPVLRLILPGAPAER
jgi:signal transduction histidine kinase